MQLAPSYEHVLLPPSPVRVQACPSGTAARVAARRGPTWQLTVDTCARICDACAKRCLEFDDEHMKKCAKSCQSCAKSCRAMLAAAKK